MSDLLAWPPTSKAEHRQLAPKLWKVLQGRCPGEDIRSLWRPRGDVTAFRIHLPWAEIPALPLTLPNHLGPKVTLPF